MIPKTIKTDERIFEVSDSEGNIYLCNLNHLKLDVNEQELLTPNGYSIRLLKHYWNKTFKKIAKRDVKDMLLAQRGNKQTV